VQGMDQTHADVRRPANIQSSRRDNPATRDFAAQTEPLPMIPPLESRVGFRLHEPGDTPRWQIELSARMVAGQNNVATSLGELPTPGFTVFDVRGYWQATDRLLLTAGVENFGDRLYREHLDPVAGNLIGFPFYRPGTNFYFTSQFTY
jgi:iron complex outermembrane recepter protein